VVNPLLDENTLLASAECSSRFPNGEAHFIEDKEGPPNKVAVKKRLAPFTDYFYFTSRCRYLLSIFAVKPISDSKR
jgi:hypothetical protein